MKYIKTYEKITEYDDIEISDGSYWIIYGSVYDVILILQKFKKLFPSDENELDINRSINRLYKDKKENIIGVYYYFSSYGVSYSLLKNEEDKIRIYNNHLKVNVYEFKGELKMIDNKLFLDDSEKIMFDNTIKFNI